MAQGSTVSTDNLVGLCCGLDITFTDGNEEIETGSTNKSIRLNSNIKDATGCEGTWFHKNACEPSYQDITDESNQDNGDQLSHYPDKWGSVQYKVNLQCDNRRVDCGDNAILPVVDWGFWFFNEEGELRRYRSAKSLPLDFYNPNRPTILFIHGLRQGASEKEIRQDFMLRTLELDGSGNPVIDDEGNVQYESEEFLPALWMERGYNFAIFNWTQFADMEDMTSVEMKLYDDLLVDWRKPNGELVVDHLPEQQDIVQMMNEQYDEWSPNRPVRVVGHGIGAQLALELADHMRDRRDADLIDKVVMLNGWWSEGIRTYQFPDEPEEKHRSMSAFKHSLVIANRLNEHSIQVPLEGYRNLRFDKDEFNEEEDLPAYAGNDNDSIKAVSAFSLMETNWDNKLAVRPEVNDVVFDEEAHRRHEAMYLWYLKSIDYVNFGEIVSSIRPTIDGEPFDASFCDWDDFAYFSLNANTDRSETLTRQNEMYFFSQVEGTDTPETIDDVLVQENFCICELERVADYGQQGLFAPHAMAMLEYANCEELSLFLRTPDITTPDHVQAMYEQRNHYPSPVYRMPYLRADDTEDGDNCGPNFSGLASIHPEISRIRGLVGPGIEEKIPVLAINKAYRGFVFDTLKSHRLHVYPMKIFSERRWNETMTQALIHNKIDKGWQIQSTACYLVKDSLSNKIFNSYRFHGGYEEATGDAWDEEASKLNELNEEINRLTEVYHGFNIDDLTFEEEKARYQMIQNLFTHDNWQHKNDWYKAGPEMGPQANLTVVMPNGYMYRLEEKDVAAQKRMYECMGIDWQELYPDEEDDSDPNKDIYYMPADEISDDDSNIGGYPVLYDPENSITAGRPTEGQREYDPPGNDPGRYNETQRARKERDVFFDMLSTFRGISSYDFDWTDYVAGTDAAPSVANAVGMHPHHYKRFGQFATDYQIILSNRNSNPAAVKWIDRMYEGGKYRPKPFAIKGKSIKSASYKDLPISDTDQETNFELGARVDNSEGSETSIRFVGPGYGIIDDKNTSIYDINCEGQAGLASFDPRTVRGRGLVDPPRDFDKINLPCEHTDFEEKYASSLQSKMLANGYYVFPIPFFANKYQQYFRFQTVYELGTNGVVSSHFDGRELVYTDQFARLIQLRLVYNGIPLEYDPDLGFGHASTPQYWTARQLDEVIRTQGASNATAARIRVQAYHDDLLPFEMGNPTYLLWERHLGQIRPLHTTYPTAYEAYDELSPVWLRGTPGNEHPISFPVNASNPNQAFHWIGFFKKDGTTLFEPKLQDGSANLKGAGVPPTNWGDPVMDPNTGLVTDNWDDKSWVEVYYEILKRYYYDKERPDLTHDPVNDWQLNAIYPHTCYTVKDQQGNNYYSDYDMHGYYFSDLYETEDLRGIRWWTSYLTDPFAQLPRQLINHYLMQGFPKPATEPGVTSPASLYTSDAGEIDQYIRDNFQFAGAARPDWQATSKFDLIQHGPHDDWNDRNNYGAAEVNAGPQSNMTIWVPLNEKDVRVYTLTENTPTYVQEVVYKAWGLNWESIYPQDAYAINEDVGHQRGTPLMSVTKESAANKPCIYWSDQNHGCKYEWTTADVGGIVEGLPTDIVKQIKQFKNYFKAHKVAAGAAPDGSQLDPTLDVELAEQASARALAVLAENPNNCEVLGFPDGDEPPVILNRLDMASGTPFNAVPMVDVRSQRVGNFLENYFTRFSEIVVDSDYPSQPQSQTFGKVRYSTVGGVSFTDLDAAAASNKIEPPGSYDLISIQRPFIVNNVPSLTQIWKYLKPSTGAVRVVLEEGDYHYVRAGSVETLLTEECFWGYLNAYYKNINIFFHEGPEQLTDFAPIVNGREYVVYGEKDPEPRPVECDVAPVIEPDGSVTFQRTLGPTSLANARRLMTGSVYPNPASDLLTLVVPEKMWSDGHAITVSAVALDGRVLMEETLEMPLWKEYPFRVDEWRPGVYLLHLTTDEEKVSIPFLVR